MTSDSAQLVNDLQYLNGFGNEHESEALPGALPVGRFSPQRVNYGLYAEQFSSTAFTAPRAVNRRTWFYRIRPSVVQSDYQPWQQSTGHVSTGPITEVPTPPNMLRWDPRPLPEQPTDFIEGLQTIAANGDAN
ncbi:MAG: homogentisate 1,2-dioxygenase, partial [Pseudomonadota bacterium]